MPKVSDDRNRTIHFTVDMTYNAERMHDDEQRPIVTKVGDRWVYNCGKFKGDPVDLKGNPPYIDYFEWAVRVGAIPMALLRSEPELLGYSRYCDRYRLESREKFESRRRRRFKGGDHWYSDELDSGLGDVSGQAAMMEDW